MQHKYFLVYIYIYIYIYNYLRSGGGLVVERLAIDHKVVDWNHTHCGNQFLLNARSSNLFSLT